MSLFRVTFKENCLTRATRILEMLIRLRAAPRLTAQQLADEFEVSRRTMQRDLQTLADLGVRIEAILGPGGGFRLERYQQMAPLSLSVDEALGVLLAYNALWRPGAQSLAPESTGPSAAAKLRAALPAETLVELERLRTHVAIIARPTGEPAPLLSHLLQAALDGTHIRVTYESKSGRSDRIIYPHGIYVMGGCWYCACYDRKRGANISLRADRVTDLERVEGAWERPTRIPMSAWLDTIERDDGQGLPLIARVTPRGAQSRSARAVRRYTSGWGGWRIDRGKHPPIRSRLVHGPTPGDGNGDRCGVSLGTDRSNARSGDRNRQPVPTEHGQLGGGVPEANGSTVHRRQLCELLA